MNSLQEYFLEKDSQIKEIVFSFGNYMNIDINFKGYYIEGNDMFGSFTPKPFFETYEIYRRENPYSIVSHVRYFFELNKDDLEHMLTIHLNHKRIYGVSFSIDELAEGFEDNSPELKFKESDFEQLIDIIKRKFDN